MKTVAIAIYACYGGTDPMFYTCCNGFPRRAALPWRTHGGAPAKAEGLDGTLPQSICGLLDFPRTHPPPTAEDLNGTAPIPKQCLSSDHWNPLHTLPPRSKGPGRNLTLPDAVLDFCNFPNAPPPTPIKFKSYVRRQTFVTAILM